MSIVTCKVKIRFDSPTPGHGSIDSRPIQIQFQSDYSPTELSDLQSLRGLFQEDSLTIILARMRCRGRQVDSLTMRSSLLMKCLLALSSPAYLGRRGRR